MLEVKVERVADLTQVVVFFRAYLLLHVVFPGAKLHTQLSLPLAKVNLLLAQCNGKALFLKHQMAHLFLQLGYSLPFFIAHVPNLAELVLVHFFLGARRHQC